MASFTDTNYSQQTSHDFLVQLKSSCASATLTNPGQASTTNPADYYYSGAARFAINQFVTDPVSCSVSYACVMVDGPAGLDLCSYNDSGMTVATFDTSTGSYSFTSIDFPTFKEEKMTFEITGTSGS